MKVKPENGTSKSCRTGSVNLKQFHRDWYLAALAVTEPSTYVHSRDLAYSTP
jgi:hypothetical protein